MMTSLSNYSNEPNPISVNENDLSNNNSYYNRQKNSGYVSRGGSKTYNNKQRYPFNNFNSKNYKNNNNNNNNNNSNNNNRLNNNGNRSQSPRHSRSRSRSRTRSTLNQSNTNNHRLNRQE